MSDHSGQVLTLPADALPPDLAALLGDGALLLSLERLDDGRVAVQALPEIDPTLVVRIRKVLAQHADVLRRLT